MEIIVLDGAKMETKEAAHKYLAKMLHFPAYYGENLDALADCLSELGPHVHIILMNQKAMEEQLGDYGKSIIDTFIEITGTRDSGSFVIDKE